MMIVRDRKYSGHPPWGSHGELQTCRAFIALLEQKRPDVNQRVNVFADFLEGPALDWFLHLKGDLKQDWNFLQSQLASRFRVPPLSIVQKFHIRQSLLKQCLSSGECVQEFVERCILAQFAIEDSKVSWISSIGIITDLFKFIKDIQGVCDLF